MATVHPLPEAKTAGKIMAPSSPGSTTFPSSNTMNINNSNSGEVFWYFAIGSMMNPLSMKNRSIVPLTSVPGELFDYELVFTGGMGFAEAIPCPGSSFHGVLHRLDSETMERLDKMEIVYKRVDGKARMYDGTTVTATVYTKSGTFGQENNPPFQRYLDIMIEGAKHFEVNPKQINFFKNYKCRPRPLPQEFESYGEPAQDAPLLTYENDVVPFDGVNSSHLRLAINGKVIEICVEEVTSSLFKNSLFFYKQYGHRLELVFSKVLYDPQYGCPEKLENFTREHSAYIESMSYTIESHQHTIHQWKTVGRIEQSYLD